MTHLPGKAPLPSTAAGAVMAAAAGSHTAGTASILTALTALAVLAGIMFRLAATLAVLLAAATVLLSNPPLLPTWAVGLSAAVYLMLAHSDGDRPLLTALSSPAMVAAVGFTAIGMVAALLPLDLPWLPILAPPTLFLAYVLAVQPFFTAAVGTRRSNRDET